METPALLIRTAHGTLLAGDPAAPCHHPNEPPLVAVRTGERECILSREDQTVPTPFRLEAHAFGPGAALRRLDGGLLTALPDGRVVQDRTAIGGWEIFSLEPVPDTAATVMAAANDLDTICRDPLGDPALLAAHLALAGEARRRALLADLAASRSDYPDIFARLRRTLSGGAERSPWHTRVHLRDGIETYGWSVGDHTYGNPAIVEAQYGTLCIGRYCSIAGGVRIILANHAINTVTTYPFASLARFWPSAPDDINADHVGDGVVIGHSVWIGQEAMLLPGARVGDGAIVGAGAVVAKPVPPYSVVVGNPARLTRIRFPEDQIQRLLAVRWWHWPDERVDRFVPLLLGDDIEAFLRAAEALDTPRLGS